MDRESKIKHLDSDYRDAFGAWALQVSRLQDISRAQDLSLPAGVGLGAADAEERVAAAEIDYRKTRDLLTAGMSNKIGACD